MKCPNCSNEAINVNGKYVCLDCGIEISPNQKGDELGDSLEPSITNHNPVFAEPVNTETPQFMPPVNDPSQVSATPVKEAFLSELNQEESPAGGGVYDFSQTDDQATQATQADPSVAVADFPNPSDVNLNQSLPTEPQEAVPELPVNTMPEPVVQEPPQPASLGETQTQESQEPQVPVESPETENISIPEPPVAESQMPEAPPTEPETYFQPSQLDIKPSSVEVAQSQPTEEVIIQPESVIQPSPLVEEPQQVPASDFNPSTPNVGTEIPVTTNSASITEPQVANTDTGFEANVETTPRVNPGENLDDLLDKYSSPQPEYPPAVAPIPNGPATFDSVRPNTPVSGSQNVVVGSGMPSTESVFGAEGLEDPTLAMEKNQAKNKKLRMILFGVGGAVLILLIILGVVLSQQKAQRDANKRREEFVQSMMTGVSQKMDEPLDVKVSFRHSLDFSTVSLKPKVDPDLGKNLITLFSAPVLNEGRWDTNNKGDILQANKFGATFYEQVYVEQEKMTYFKENGVWGKKQGREIVAIPGFYGAIERGSIFYPSKVESLKFVGIEEDENGQDLTTLQVKPNAEFLKEIIGAVTPALTKVNYQTVDASGLVIEVVVDESNYIQGVTAKGDINVVCDYFEGKIKVDSEAVYEYSASEIEKPELSQKTPLIILTNTVVQGDFESAPKKEETEGRG